jgi:uncharacterized membrane protein YebE (DUF533 family)
MNSSMKNQLSVLCVGGAILLAGCNSGYDNNTTRSAGAGAAVGAVIGGIIGHQSGEAASGAALGAVAGGAAGGTYGYQKDKRANDHQARDSYGFSEDAYYNLMNSEEHQILRARAQGRNDVQLTSLLTFEERANLRRRANGPSTVSR